jgi:hypothetical protein
MMLKFTCIYHKHEDSFSDSLFDSPFADLELENLRSFNIPNMDYYDEFNFSCSCVVDAITTAIETLAIVGGKIDLYHLKNDTTGEVVLKKQKFRLS